MKITAKTEEELEGKLHDSESDYSDDWGSDDDESNSE
jgi:hypothetical protein